MAPKKFKEKEETVQASSSSSAESSEEEQSSDEEEDVKPIETEKPSNEEAEDEIQIPQPSKSNGSDYEPESGDSTSDYELNHIPKHSKISEKKQKIDETKSTPIRRRTGGVWSDEDVIALLNVLFELKNSKEDVKASYDHIKGKLKGDFSNAQVNDKIRRLKNRFLNARKRGWNGLDEPVFSKPHEVLIYQLSKKLWDNEVIDNSEKKTGKRVRKKSGKNIGIVEDVISWSEYPFLNESFCKLGRALTMSGDETSHVKDRLRAIGTVKAEELVGKLKQVVLKETEIHYKRLNLMRKQVKRVLDQ